MLYNYLAMICYSCGLPCPVNYNPVDHYVQTLAMVPGEEEQSRQRIERVCEQFDNSAQGLEIGKLVDIVPDKRDSSNNKTSPYKVGWFYILKCQTLF